jgi:hypothetical protein
MVDVVRISIGGAAHWDHLSSRKLACFRAIRCVEGAKHVVVGSVFLDKENNVIDFLNSGGPGALLRTGEGNGGKKPASESPGIRHEKTSCSAPNAAEGFMLTRLLQEVK